MTGIVIRHSLVAAWVETVLDNDTLSILGGEIQRLGIGIRGIELQAVPGPHLRREPECVVAGGADAHVVRDIAQVCARTNRANGGESLEYTGFTRNKKLIQVDASAQVAPLRTKIPQHHAPLSRDL